MEPREDECTDLLGVILCERTLLYLQYADYM